ncbi:hypothetical protein EDEG_00774 [Edhazardia aedis USNM 41457]|uniref:Uncharacterized protein n=1 Tax=Edhazardia aedis (strain USNM 41457) TaxID=1003232 RepID=J9DV23_EDHAE|nr:hypothetical protein EDEG_00774 [Edhazardia aedis USNM 41457]|eukprot:EJW05127.1 hypothetical protein EDEG_00774 [Edhazardia aedis USNM 41457]
MFLIHITDARKKHFHRLLFIFILYHLINSITCFRFIALSNKDFHKFTWKCSFCPPYKDQNIFLILTYMKSIIVSTALYEVYLKERSSIYQTPTNNFFLLNL